MKTQGFDVVFFDLDGTLTDTEHLTILSTRSALQRLALAPLTDAEHAQVIGRPATQSLPPLLLARGASEDLLAPAIIAYRTEYDALWDTAVRLMPYADSVIRELSRRRTILSVCTTNRRSVVNKFLDRFRFRDCFAFTLSRDEVAEVKPHPAIYLLATKILQTDYPIPSEQILCVEDTPRGVRAAKDAGLACAAIPHELTHHEDFSHADFALQSLQGILELVGGS